MHRSHHYPSPKTAVAANITVARWWARTIQCSILTMLLCVLTETELRARPVMDTSNPYYGPNYERAHFPGGDNALKEFIETNTVYPAEYRDSKIRGRTIVRFIVDEQGRISGITVIRSLAPACDAEAKCVIADMPAWLPATYKRRPVRSVQSVGINFAIE